MLLTFIKHISPLKVQLSKSNEYIASFYKVHMLIFICSSGQMAESKYLLEQRVKGWQDQKTRLKWWEIL